MPNNPNRDIVEVTTTSEARLNKSTDEALLIWATAENRVLLVYMLDGTVMYDRLEFVSRSSLYAEHEALAGFFHKLSRRIRSV